MLLDNLFMTPKITVDQALIISLVCMLSIVLAKLIGCTLPLFAKAIKLDPAVVASPLMTTIVDAVALLLYCAISIAAIG